MQIYVKEPIKHGRERFEAGETRVVDRGVGEYFVKNGWAREVGGEDVPAQPSDVTLDVQSGSHGMKDSNHG